VSPSTPVRAALPSRSTSALAPRREKYKKFSRLAIQMVFLSSCGDAIRICFPKLLAHLLFLWCCKCPSRSQTKNYCILTCQPTPTFALIFSVALLARWRSNITIFRFGFFSFESGLNCNISLILGGVSSVFSFIVGRTCFCLTVSAVDVHDRSFK
jgi:hypothetical protein